MLAPSSWVRNLRSACVSETAPPSCRMTLGSEAPGAAGGEQLAAWETLAEPTRAGVQTEAGPLCVSQLWLCNNSAHT